MRSFWNFIFELFILVLEFYTVIVDIKDKTQTSFKYLFQKAQEHGISG